MDLIEACRKSDYDKINKILSNNVRNIYYIDHHGETPLMYLVRYFNDFPDNPIKCLKLLLDYAKYLDFFEFINYINHRNNKGYTALSEASYHKNYDAIVLLLKTGANPNINTYDQHTLLMNVIQHDDRNPDYIGRKLQNPNNPNNKIKCLKILLKAGANPYIKHSTDKTSALTFAMLYNMGNIIKILKRLPILLFLHDYLL